MLAAVPKEGWFASFIALHNPGLTFIHAKYHGWHEEPVTDAKCQRRGLARSRGACHRVPPSVRHLSRSSSSSHLISSQMRSKGCWVAATTPPKFPHPPLLEARAAVSGVTFPSCKCQSARTHTSHGNAVLTLRLDSRSAPRQ